jgi:hypothetical protein
MEVVFSLMSISGVVEDAEGAKLVPRSGDGRQEL